MPIRVILADDHEVVREGIRELFRKEKTIKVVAEAGDGQETVALAKKHKPGIVIMDVSMDGMDGCQATREICRRLPNTRVVALSMHSDAGIVLRMLRAGAYGYLVKQDCFKEVVRAVLAVADGDFYLSRSIDATSLFGWQHASGGKGASPGGHAGFTPREREIKELVDARLSTKEIARLLGISVKTAETHRRNLNRKLNDRA